MIQDQQGGVNRALERWPASKPQRDLHWHARREIIPGPGFAIGHEDLSIPGPGAVNIRFTESAPVDKFLPIGRNPDPRPVSPTRNSG